MKVKSLSIEMPEYGNNAGQYVGSVILEGTRGKQELQLSPGAIGRIFVTIQQEAGETAKFNAKQTTQALEDATNTTALLGHTIEGLD